MKDRYTAEDATSFSAQPGTLGSVLRELGSYFPSTYALKEAINERRRERSLKNFAAAAIDLLNSLK